jgi:hypothetical protein
LPYLSAGISCSEPVLNIISTIKDNVYIGAVNKQEAVGELSEIVDRKILGVAQIFAAYRSPSGSLICLMGVTEYLFEISIYSKASLSQAVSDFTWFWNALKGISPLKGSIWFENIREIRIEKPMFLKLIKEAGFPSILVASSLNLVQYFTGNIYVAVVVAMGAFFLYIIVVRSIS